MAIGKKRGRKCVNEYYQTKKADSVEIEDIITIHLPISLDECNHNPNIDRQVEILSSTPPPLVAYSPENVIYSKVIIEKDIVSKTQDSPVNVVSIDTQTQIIRKEIYDISILKTYKEVVNIKTDIACWWCCHTFTNVCVSMPISLIRDVYNTHGIFCSYSCCYSYMQNTPKYFKNRYLLNYMFRDSTGKKGVILDHVKPAPPRETLKLFGGPLSIEDFRDNSCFVSVNKYPVVYKQTQMEKTTKIQKTKQKVCKILPASKKYMPTKINIPNNSLGKILGISID
jgi:hypothetical protein